MLLRHPCRLVHHLSEGEQGSPQGPHASQAALDPQHSPAMLPRAQTACSLMCSMGEPNSVMKAGMAPFSTTCCVCQDVPEAMFVRAQAASNCSVGSSSLPRKSTKRASSPASMISFRGGFLSLESSFLWGWEPVIKVMATNHNSEEFQGFSKDKDLQRTDSSPSS